MASSTTNLDLILPVGGENVSRQIINANNVKIDEAVGAVPSGTDLQSQVTALNNNVTNLLNKAITIYNAPSSSNQIDLDDVRSLSYVYVTVSNKAYLLNKPAAVQCHVFSVGNGTRCMQFCYDVDNFVLYIRSRGGNSWGNWTQIGP